jgi:allantoinase
MFHAELEEEVESQTSESIKYQSFLETRPPSMEISAIAMILSVLEEFPNARAHIVHLSAAGAIPLIREARSKGYKLTAETCFHYLTLDSESVPDGATEFKCCPPIRERENREKLWKGLLDGDIDFVVSDHSPSTPDIKKSLCCGGSGDFLGAWGGIGGLGLGLPLLWKEAVERNIR